MLLSPANNYCRDEDLSSGSCLSDVLFPYFNLEQPLHRVGEPAACAVLCPFVSCCLLAKSFFSVWGFILPLATQQLNQVFAFTCLLKKQSGTCGGKCSWTSYNFHTGQRQPRNGHSGSLHCPSPVPNANWEGRCPAPLLISRAKAESRGTEIPPWGPHAGKSFVK